MTEWLTSIDTAQDGVETAEDETDENHNKHNTEAYSETDR